MTALTLFDVGSSPKARHADPVTSLAAAKSVDGGAVETQILHAFQAERHAWYMGGMTADELGARLPLVRQDTLRSALSRLKDQGQVRDSGERRPSNAGRQMTVWTLVR
jgi:hypothetical protein